MRRLTDLKDAALAQGFFNMLLENGIDAQITDDYGRQDIWILDDDNLESASKLLRDFLNNPQPAMIDKKGPQERPKAQNKQAYVRTHVWSAEEPNRMLTVILILISSFVYMGQEGAFPASIISKLYIADPVYLTQPFSDILSGEVWRLISPIFLHFNVIHILFNMIWLYQLGCMIETIEGSKKLLLLVFIAGALSNTLQYVLKGPAFGGMSGVIYGLLSYAWGMGRWQPASGYFIDKGTFGFMMVWLVLCFLGTFGPVANYAHLGGFLVGITWAKWPSLKNAN